MGVMEVLGMRYTKMKSIYQLLGLCVVLLVLPSISAVTLDSGTILNTTGSNSSMTFGSCSWVIETVTISEISIEITGASDLQIGSTLYAFPDLVNHTVENTNYDCEEIGIAFSNDINNEQITEICNESGLTFLEASAIAGVLLTIVLIGGAIAIMMLAFSGFITIDPRNINFQMTDLLAGVLVTGLAFLVLATMAFLVTGTYCPAIGGG